MFKKLKKIFVFLSWVCLILVVIWMFFGLANLSVEAYVFATFTAFLFELYIICKKKLIFFYPRIIKFLDNATPLSGYILFALFILSSTMSHANGNWLSDFTVYIMFVIVYFVIRDGLKMLKAKIK